MPQNSMGFTLTVQFDRTQYETILRELRTIKQLIMDTIDDPAKLAALTAKLKQSEDALSVIVAQNK